MDFSLTDDQRQIGEAMERLCRDFDADYWLAHDDSGEFPEDFHAALAADGWLGIAMPPEYGGAGLGIVEAAIMMQTIAQSGAAMSGASAVHINVFGAHPIVVHGTAAQKARMLTPLIEGAEKCCFAVTEPDAGLNTAAIRTRARRSGDHYIVSGQKIWTTTAQEADKILLLARTTPKEECARPFDGISLFYTDLDRDYVDVRVIPKMGRKAVDSNELFFDGLKVPAEDLIGEEGKGFSYLLDGLNPERILVAVEAVGIGRAALARAAEYAGQRVVFGRPIGQNQAIQHPLADSWAKLEAANLMAFKAATLYDSGAACGVEANAAKYLGAEAGFEACTRAVMTHGGMGYAREFHVERYMREILICRIAPVTPHLILSYLAERALGLPKSY
jgi:acyl-CoA dehydrogenase